MMLKKISYTCLFICSSFPVYANVIQYFAGISYSNPAELSKVANYEVIGGSTGFDVNARFRGTVLNFNTFQYDYGTSYSKTSSLLPYFRAAKRLSPSAVISVDVTQPFHSNLDWGSESFTKYASTQTLLRDIDIDPRFTWSFTEKFHGGIGINLNFLKNNETNWALPSSATESAILNNPSSSFGVGFNAGISYVLNQKNIFGATYYSAIRQNTTGTSTFNGTSNPNLSFNFHMPATTVLNYVHIFNPKFLVNANIFMTEWNINQYARYRNTAAPPPFSPHFNFHMGYKRGFAYLLAARTQINEKFSGTLLGVIDNGPERNELRTINFPSDVQYLIGVSADYQINKNLLVQLLYGHVYSKTLIQNRLDLGSQNVAFTTGRVLINADVIDLRLKITGDDNSKKATGK